MADPGPPQLPEHPRVWDRLALSLINDPRDIVFVHLMIACTITALLGLSLYPLGRVLDGYAFWAAGVVYLAIWGLWTLDRFILMLHCTSHRILFRREHAWLNHVIPLFLGPFFGETPQTYFCHHMGMHHPENNLPDDLSSTMRFQRDSFGHWLRYFLRFFFLVIIELPIYFFKRGQPKMGYRAVFGELSFWLVIGALAYFVDWRATLVVFVVPVLMVRVLMMAGNWAQHAFVDAEHPGDPYRNSITCIDSRYNRRCFNDGYHIYHHVKARCHWSEYPSEFQTNKTTYGEHDAIVFRGLDFFIVWVLLMVGAYRKLAEAMVELPGAPQRSIDERIAFMRSRLRPIG